MVIDQYGVQKQRICPVSDDSFPEHDRDLNRTTEGAATSLAEGGGENICEARDREGGREMERRGREQREREERGEKEKEIIIDIPTA
jgi:hypothetical protein